MSMHEQRIAQAWLEAPDSGIIELTRDWTGAAMPPLSLGEGGPAFARLTRVPDHTFGCEIGHRFYPDAKAAWLGVVGRAAPPPPPDPRSNIPSGP